MKDVITFFIIFSSINVNAILLYSLTSSTYSLLSHWQGLQGSLLLIITPKSFSVSDACRLTPQFAVKAKNVSQILIYGISVHWIVSVTENYIHIISLNHSLILLTEVFIFCCPFYFCTITQQIHTAFCSNVDFHNIYIHQKPDRCQLCVGGGLLRDYTSYLTFVGSNLVTITSLCWSLDKAGILTHHTPHLPCSERAITHPPEKKTFRLEWDSNLSLLDGSRYQVCV